MPKKAFFRYIFALITSVLAGYFNVALAAGSAPANIVNLYGYYVYATPPEATGFGTTPEQACADFFSKNGYGGVSPPLTVTVVGLSCTFSQYGNTYRYNNIAEVVTPEPRCPPYDSFSPSGRCDCPKGQALNAAGNACEAERTLYSKLDSCDGNCVGHPIIPATGEKILHEEDFADSVPHGLSFVRTYKSQRSLGQYTGHPWSNFDRRWSHNHSTKLVLTDGDMRILWGDGRVNSFGLNTTTGTWSPLDSVSELGYSSTTAQWTFVDKSTDTRWMFDADGKPLTATLRNGWTTTYGYSTSSTSSSIAPAPGLLISVTNQFGRAINLRYNADSTISTVYLPNGRNLSMYYQYGTGMLEAVEWPGGSKGYAYEVSGKPWLLTGKFTSVTGRHATYAYDSSGRAISTQLTGGADLYTVAYPSATDRLVTDPLGTQRTYSYANNRGNLTVVAATYPSDKGLRDAASRVQDANGLITSETDFLGFVTAKTWDTGRELPLSVTAAVGQPEEQAVQYRWHATFSLPLGITESGRATAYTYDANGNKLSEAVTDLATSVTRTTQWTYNASSLPATMTDPKGGVWQFAYNSLGNVTSIKNPLNHETVFTYNSYGQLETETSPTGLVTTYTYDSSHRVNYIFRGSEPEITNFAYDGNDQVTYVKFPNGYKLWFEYDAALRLKSVTDSLNNVTAYTLDAAGNRVAETVKDGANNVALAVTRVMSALNRVSQIKDSANNATTLAYNANGDVTGQTEPLSRTTSQTLDGLRRPTSTTFPDSSSASQTWNARNEVTSVTDPKSVQTTYTRNAFGEVTSETSPDVGTINYVRDALGAVTQRTDAKGNVTTITRDALGRATSIQYGPTHIVTYTWDTAPSGTPNQKGSLSKIEDPSGSITYERDLFGRVTRKTQVVNDNPSSPTTLVSWFGYINGDPWYVGYPSGLYVNYQPYGNGNLYKIGTMKPGQSSYSDFTGMPEFTPLGQPKSISFVNGASLTRSYNADGRMTANEFASYSYDAAGRMTGITQSLAATTATSSIFNTSVSWTVGYDSRDRVTSFSRAGAGSSYTYDANSNRLSSVESYSSDSDLDGDFTGTDATRINAKSLDIGSTSNKLLGFTQVVTSTSAGSTTSVVTTPVSYSLDANGAMTSDGLRNFDYDESNRLAKVRILQNGEAAAVTYLTNGLGQRVFKSEPKAEQYLPEEEELGVDFIAWLKSKFRWMFESAQATASIGTAYTYAEGGLPSWALLGEYDNGGASGTGRTEYIWLPSPDGSVTPIGMYRNNKFYTIHADHLGTPRLVKDDTNTPVWQLPYSAFGNNRPVGVLSTTTTTGYAITAGATPLKATVPAERLNLRFPGQYADSETGEFYNYFRQYDPRTGRYTQSDPIGMSGGWNRFGYVGGNSLNAYDPTGEIGQFVVAVGAIAELTILIHSAGFDPVPLPGGVGGGVKPTVLAARAAMNKVESGAVCTAQNSVNVLTEAGGLRISNTAANSIANRSYVGPLSVQETISGGVRTADPQGVAGRFMYTVEAYKNSTKGKLEVLVNEISNTVEHVVFKRGKK